MDPQDLEKLVLREECQIPTPNTPEDLLGIQKEDEHTLIHGLDLSVKARAMYLYGEELELSVKEYIDMAYAMVRRAEGGLEVYLKEELDKLKDRRDYDAVANYSIWVGGLASLRMGLRSMVESPMDPDVWRSYAGLKEEGNEAIVEPKLHSLEKRLKNLKRLMRKKLITAEEYTDLRKKTLGLKIPCSLE